MGHPGDAGLPSDDLAHGGDRDRVFLAVGFEGDQSASFRRRQIRPDRDGSLSGALPGSLCARRQVGRACRPGGDARQHPVQVQQRNRRFAGFLARLPGAEPIMPAMRST